MMAQAVTGTPGHINTMAEAVKTLRDSFALHDMKPGDIFLTNDPWIASGHLNDFLLMMPVFHRGRVIGFTSCTSHLVDLGGELLDRLLVVGQVRIDHRLGLGHAAGDPLHVLLDGDEGGSAEEFGNRSHSGLLGVAGF